jgi:hypothetical protein
MKRVALRTGAASCPTFGARALSRILFRTRYKLTRDLLNFLPNTLSLSMVVSRCPQPLTLKNISQQLKQSEIL